MLDFFEQQRRSRARSHWLLFCFLVLVVGLGLLFGQLFLWLSFAWGWHANPWFWHHPLNYLWLLLVYSTLLSPAWPAWRRYRRGGFDFALHLAAQCAYRSEDPKARVLQEVAEEMAIASGSPMPSVWVYPDADTINSFVLGRCAQDVALFVTDKAIQTLDRQQLQAMVAHEFAHLVNADLQVNHYLLIMLAILSAPVQLAKKYWQVAMPARVVKPVLAGRSRWMQPASHELRRGGGALMMIPFLAVLSLLFALLGGLGLLAGRWLRARFCRQREWLADARAVQFTRMNRYLAQTLWLGQLHNEGLMLAGGHCEVLQHLVILPSQPESWLACHPAVRDRILALGGRSLLRELQQEQRNDPEQARESLQKKAQQGLLPGDLLWQAPALGLGLAICSQALALQHAQRVRAALPPLLLDATRQPVAALGLVAGLYLQAVNSRLSPFAQAQLAERHAPAAQWLARHQFLVSELFVAARLPLLELSVPALQALPEAVLRSWLHVLPELDRDSSPTAGALDAWLLCRYVEHHLQLQPMRDGRQPLSSLGSASWVLLCYLAQAGSPMSADLWQALRQELHWQQQEPLAEKALSLTLLSRSVQRLQQVRSLDKPQLLEACARVIAADGQLQTAEYERLRLIADLLGVGMPALQY